MNGYFPFLRLCEFQRPVCFCTKEVMFSSLSVCLSAALHKNLGTDLHGIFRQGLQCPSEQTIKFWWQSESGYRSRYRSGSVSATLVRCALVEVCSVPVLLVRVLFLCVVFLVGITLE